MVKLKRAYEPKDRSDGYRVLVDRLWPRGIKKEELPLDEWAKELAPSTQVRKSFGHKPEKWQEFRVAYKLELRAPESHEKLKALAKRANQEAVTLIYSARDKEHNNAVVINEVLDRLS